MRRIIKYHYISDSITSINTKIADLKKAEDELKNNIMKIKECYQGEDGKLLMNSYLSNINKINNYINNVSKYLNYLKWLVGEYSDIQQRARNKMIALFDNNIDVRGFGESANDGRVS